jgi:isopentenyl-diphosphate delta-isomerase
VTELVVLLSPDGRPVGEADKATVHGPATPYHLAFSCYAFDAAGRLLVTRRAPTKRTWPGVWSNTCCGHPAPGEPLDAAVRRRMAYELRLHPLQLTLALPDFSYRARFDGVVEHELCPVLLCRVAGDATPHPAEVADYRWQAWADFLADTPSLSPWARLQTAALERGGHIRRFLSEREPAYPYRSTAPIPSRSAGSSSTRSASASVATAARITPADAGT